MGDVSQTQVEPPLAPLPVLSITLSTPSLRHGAGVLLFGRIDDFERLVCTGDRRAEREEVPLVLGLTLCAHREGIGLLNQLVIPRPEIAFASLQDVELRFLFE